MADYKVFKVNEIVYNSVNIGAYFKGGIVVDGTSNQVEGTEGCHNDHLLIVTYDDSDYKPESNDDRGNEP